MYGAQTTLLIKLEYIPFENDVEMYGAQTKGAIEWAADRFENDVEMYGAQTTNFCSCFSNGLRMM